MARAFKSTPKGFVADLERAERRLLRTLFQDVIQLLDDGDDGGPGPRREPGGTGLPGTGVPGRGEPGAGASGAEASGASAAAPAGAAHGRGRGRDADSAPDSSPGRDGDRDAAFWDIVAGLGPLGGTSDERPAPGESPAHGADPSSHPSPDPLHSPDPLDSPDPLHPGDPAAPARPAPRREAPADPALARLLPSGVEGDDAAAAEFRALTEDAVRRSKTEDLQRAVAALQANPVVLSEPEAVAFGRALNDVRLVLSARLGIETEEDAERVHEVDDWSDATDVESYMALLYNFTTWLLETLMTALSTRLPD